MSDIIDFGDKRDARQPHITVSLMCDVCGKETTNVIPAGIAPPFECGHCKEMEARPLTLVRKQTNWHCGICNGSLFRIAPDGPYCATCGIDIDLNELLFRF